LQKAKIGVLVSGGGTNLQSLIDAALQGQINGEIVLVISDKKDAYALERAKKHGIEALFLDKKAYSDRSAFASSIIDAFDKRNIDLIVMAGFMTVLHADMVNHYQGRIINIHPSLIPSFCGDGFYGDRVHKAVIEYGVKISGATVHFVDEVTDNGPIILQDVVSVEDTDTPETLAAKVLKIEHRLLPEAVGLFCEGRLMIEGRKVKIKNS
jgi:phosphoribosylglycinamide formyltransferase-1